MIKLILSGLAIYKFMIDILLGVKCIQQSAWQFPKKKQLMERTQERGRT